jgi:UPF0176 protein
MNSIAEKTSEEAPFLNVCGYGFFELKNAEEIRFPLRDFCRELGLKGTVLLADEGVNSYVAGPKEAVEKYQKHVHEVLGWPKFFYKGSWSKEQPYSRMLVKIKKEIVTMGVPGVEPHKFSGPHLKPTELKKWFDEGKDFTVLDTRNDYEIALGKFKGAIDLDVGSFREFAQKAKELPQEMKDKPLLMYCTGGIRCEKASPYFIKNLGFKEVYQIEGGILNYFLECGKEHWEGECFVFDKRVGVDPDCEETGTTQCFNCRTPLTTIDLASPEYEPSVSCPYCKGDSKALDRYTKQA